jgi:two-component system phosphate regulon response regulator OmpR
VQVTRLRKKLEDDPRMPRYLQTVRGMGYMLRPD